MEFLSLLSEIVLDMKQKFLSWLSSWLSENHLSWINEHFMWIVIIVVIIIGFILAFIYDSRKSKKRVESLKEIGPQKLFHSFPNENLISKFREPTGVMQFIHSDDVYRCFLGSGAKILIDGVYRGFFGNGAKNLIEGNIGSIDFVTYDYEYREGSGGPGGDSKTFRGTAIFLQSDQMVLPSFKWDRIGIQPGRPRRAKQAGFKQCPTCGSLDIRRGAAIEGGGIGDWCEHCKKSLYKMDEEKAHNLYKMHEEKVLKLFEFVSIADLSGLTALASNTQLLLYQKSMVPVEKYQKFIEKALKIFQMFQSASQNLNKHA